MSDEDKDKQDDVSTYYRLVVPIPQADGSNVRGYLAFGLFVTRVPWHPPVEYVGSFSDTDVFVTIKPGSEVELNAPIVLDPALAVTYRQPDPDVLKMVQKFAPGARFVKVTMRRVRR